LGLRAERFAFGASEKPTNEIQQALDSDVGRVFCASLTEGFYLIESFPSTLKAVR
jgi:hypothetical protein